MAVPPKSMRQGVYWVQTALRLQRQQQREALRAQRDLAFNELREQAIAFEREWLDPIVDIKVSANDAKSVSGEIKRLRKVIGTCAEKPRLSDGDLERITFKLLNAIFNVAGACIRYGVKKTRPPRIRWSATECVVYIGEVPYMKLKHGGRINSLDCTVSVLPGNQLNP